MPKATRVSHNGPSVPGNSGGYGPRYYPHKPVSDVAVALGCSPRSRDKVYLSVAEIVSYGVVARPKGQPKVTVEDVVRAINDLALNHHAVRDGQLVYDPIPIRVALSADSTETVAEAIRSYDEMYVHVASVLRGRIKPAHPGRLPSVKALAREFGVSEQVIGDAFGILRAEGVIVSKQGIGTFVADKKEAS